MTFCRTIAFLAFAALAVGTGCMTRRDLRPGRTLLSARTVILPAQVVGCHFLVDGKWDKRGPWHFLVDTGSSVTVVSPEFAQRYGNKPNPRAPAIRVRSAGGESILLPTVTLHRLSLGKARFENVQAVIRDLGELSNHLGVKIDGVLGFSLFRDTVFTLDYPASKIEIGSPGQFAERGGTTIKFSNSERTPLIPLTLGEIPFTALIDSGSDGPLFLNPTGLEVQYVTPPRTGSVVGTLTGNRTQEIARLAPTLTIGNFHFIEPVADLTDQQSSIGGEILRNFRITFDQSYHQVTFFRADGAPIITPARRISGMAFAKGPTYWRVASIVPGSPAESAGIHEGDLVTRVNGETIANWPLQRFDPYVKRSTEIVFTFIDGAKERPVVIPTFDLVP